MSKEELLAEILRLPVEERRWLIAEVEMQWEPAAEMTPALRAELERRYEDMLAHPERESSWKEVSARLLARQAKR